MNHCKHCGQPLPIPAKPAKVMPFQYRVEPRYTAGSPALVDFHTARQVAREEQQAYEAYMNGAHGEVNRINAENVGLEGVVTRSVWKRGELTRVDAMNELLGEGPSPL